MRALDHPLPPGRALLRTYGPALPRAIRESRACPTRTAPGTGMGCAADRPRLALFHPVRYRVQGQDLGWLPPAEEILQLAG